MHSQTNIMQKVWIKSQFAANLKNYVIIKTEKKT